MPPKRRPPARPGPGREPGKAPGKGGLAGDLKRHKTVVAVGLAGAGLVALLVLGRKNAGSGAPGSADPNATNTPAGTIAPATYDGGGFAGSSYDSNMEGLQNTLLAQLLLEQGQKNGTPPASPKPPGKPKPPKPVKPPRKRPPGKRPPPTPRPKPPRRPPRRGDRG